MSDTIYEGGCLCGAVRFRARGEPVGRALCHCRSCARAAGACGVAWATWPRDAVAFDGAPSEYASSPQVLRSFCGRCGTTLGYQHAARADTLDLTIAALDDPASIAPGFHIWLADAPPWARRVHELPRHERWRERRDDESET